MKLYVVIWEDRHTDVGVYLFSDSSKAIEWAEKQIKKTSDVIPSNQVEPHQKRYGWIYYFCYSSEGDCISIVEKEVDNNE